jgi:hypothetical protein
MSCDAGVDQIMGSPGCPEFAFWTASMARVRMELMHSWSILFG